MSVRTADERADPVAVDWRWTLTLAVATGAYLFWFRTVDLEQSFPLLGEQARDWSTAHRRFADLPFLGPRSVNSGIEIGPVYYVLLWLGQSALTPIFGHLPHVGGWFTAALQSLADVMLVVGLAVALRSAPLAAVATIAAGSSPVDAGLSASIWNPPIAVALIKFAMAAMLACAHGGRWSAAVVAFLAGVAVQAHLSAILVAMPIVLHLAIARLRRRQLRNAAAVIGAALLALGPILTSAWSSTGSRPESVAGSVAAVAQNPAGRLRIDESADAVADALESILLHPYEWHGLRWVLVGCGVLLLATRPLGAVTTLAVAPATMAVVLFSLWQGTFGERYIFLVLAPSAVLCLVAPIAQFTPSGRTIGTVALAGLVAAAQPARALETWTGRGRLPAYGPLSAGARSLAASGVAVCGVHAGFPTPAGMDPAFLLQMAGGTIAPNAGITAVIEADGVVRLVPAC